MCAGCCSGFLGCGIGVGLVLFGRSTAPGAAGQWAQAVDLDDHFVAEIDAVDLDDHFVAEIDAVDLDDHFVAEIDAVDLDDHFVAEIDPSPSTVLEWERGSLKVCSAAALFAVDRVEVKRDQCQQVCAFLSAVSARPDGFHGFAQLRLRLGR